jgi:3-isopropylmalate/(R)-2-methylmalate dehydratase small subunit
MLYGGGMQSLITGLAYVLGDNIDTDQIIPANFLSFNPSIPDERKYFGKYAMSGVPETTPGYVPFIEGESFRSKYSVVIGGRNYGCGSSREHAPLALAEAGVRAVVAEFYARIFYRNSINGGYLLPLETPLRLCDIIQTGDEVSLDLQARTLDHKGVQYSLNPLGDVLPIIEAGGVFAYAREAGMIK